MTLAECPVPLARCSSCGALIPGSVAVEHYPTNHSAWIVVECPKCRLCTPFQLQLEAAHAV